MASAATAIGIDLGTTNCCIAIFRNQTKAEIIGSANNGKNYTPSYIAFPNDDSEEDRGSELVFGETAKDNAHNNLNFTIYDVKRMIGSEFKDPRVQRDKFFWPFNIIDQAGQIRVKTSNSGTHSPIEITVEMLKHLKEVASNYLNEEVTHAVVAVPAYYNVLQEQLVSKACSLAGLTLLQLAKEPIAAAVAYKIDKKFHDDSKPTRNCVIFDLGGGTLDIAILTVDSDKIHVRAVGGDEHLGGNDIDQNIYEYCIQQFKHKHKVDLFKEEGKSEETRALKIKKRLRRFKTDCEKHKCNLSEMPETTITSRAMYENITLVETMTRELFNSLNQGIFDKCIAKLEEVLLRSGLDKKDIDDVVPVGGSCRIPGLRERVRTFFGDKQLSQSVDEDEAVAAGAAILAYYAQHNEIPSILVHQRQEAQPFSVGIDLGNTSCSVAVLRDATGEPEIIPSETGKRTVPSYVSYTNNDGVLAGELAKFPSLDYNIENTVFDIMSIIGLSMNDSQIKTLMKRLPCKLVNSDGITCVKIGDKIILPQEVAAELISHLRTIAQNYLGCPIKSAVIAVPTNFDSFQEELLGESCLKAGLETIKIIKDTKAAAISHHIDSLQTKPDKANDSKLCLVFDLGGQNFNLTLFKIKWQMEMEIIGSREEVKLGGDDFTESLTNHFIKEFQKEHGIDLMEANLSDNLQIKNLATWKRQRIKLHCEEQKRKLSSFHSVVLSLDGLHTKKRINIVVTRPLFEDLISSHLKRCVKTMKKTLKDSKVSKEDVDYVLLIGGSSRIPKVQQVVREYFQENGPKTSFLMDDQDSNAVASGAAIYAYNCFHRT